MMSETRDQLFEWLGQRDGEKKAEARHEAWVAALIRGDAYIAGARVRLEWVDPMPADLVGYWLDAHPKEISR
jgi:hypothetical protein